MFNMLIGLPDGGTLSKDRLLEGTAPHVKDLLNVAGGNFSELLKLPTLAMPEVSPNGSSDIARVGTLSGITPSGNRYNLQFTPNSNGLPIPVNELSQTRTLSTSRTHGASTGPDS